MKKYKLTDETITYQGHKLYRIEALIDLGNVKAGDKGGYVESEDNLSHEGNCWLYALSRLPMVYGNARIKDNAKIYDAAIVGDNAVVKDNVTICGHAIVIGDAVICDDAYVYDYAKIYNNAMICGRARVHGNTTVTGYAVVKDCTRVYEKAYITEAAIVCDSAVVNGVAHIGGHAVISDVCDYLIYQLPCEELNYVTWTRTDNMWHNYIGTQTSEAFIQRGYKTSQFLGDWCKLIVETQEKFAKMVEAQKGK